MNLFIYCLFPLKHYLELGYIFDKNRHIKMFPLMNRSCVIINAVDILSENDQSMQSEIHNIL